MADCRSDCWPIDRHQADSTRRFLRGGAPITTAPAS